MNGFLENLLTLELPFGLSENAILVCLPAAHAVHAQDLARLAVAAQPFG